MRRRVKAFFADQGPLARQLPGYEARPGQGTLAEAVAQAIEDETSLVAEAGTGTGKTLAYLVPALLSGRRIVISTGTKNLQEQLVKSDLPLAERALGKRYAVQVVKGRGNYLCELRAERTLAQLALPSLQDASTQQLRALQHWRQHTDTGDRAELAALPDDSPLWPKVSATFEQCLGRGCSLAERCWVIDARRRAQTAAVIVVNHHLYLADAVLRGEGDAVGSTLLPPHDLVIFDEAHDLEDIAAQHFGCDVSQARLGTLAEDLRSGSAGQGTLAARLAPSIDALGPAAAQLFDGLGLGQTESRSRIDRALHPPERVAAHAELDGIFQQLEAHLATAEAEEPKALARRCANIAQQLTFCLDLPARRTLVADVPELGRTEGQVPYVRYVEGTPGRRALVARPVDVTDVLGKTLGRTPAVFLSATLRVADSFSHCRRRLGLAPQVAELHAPSPFDYARQASLYLPDDLPTPDDPTYAQAAADRAQALVAASGGGALVLCTSHRALVGMGQALRLADVGPVYIQGQAPKHSLLKQLRQRQDAILVATLSFWQGVDVPGAALRLVIMDRLPFASPAEPWLEARLQHLRDQGIEPFMQYQLPQAALLLRQGFGRLIRRRDDRGVVAILDRRLSTKRYGRLLLRSLPACTQLSCLAEVEALLRDQRPPQSDQAATARPASCA